MSDLMKNEALPVWLPNHSPENILVPKIYSRHPVLFLSLAEIEGFNLLRIDRKQILFFFGFLLLINYKFLDGYEDFFSWFIELYYKDRGKKKWFTSYDCSPLNLKYLHISSVVPCVPRYVLYLCSPSLKVIDLNLFPIV